MLLSLCLGLMAWFSWKLGYAGFTLAARLGQKNQKQLCGTGSPNFRKKNLMFHEPNLKQNMILYFFMNQTLKTTSIFSASSRQSSGSLMPPIGGLVKHRYVPTHSELWIVPRTPKEEAEGWREGGKIHTCKETKRLNELEIRILPVTSFTYLDIHICMDVNIVHPKNPLPPELVNEGV